MASSMSASTGSGSVNLSVSLPNPVGQFMDPKNVRRILTLEPLEDFYDLSRKEKLKTILKVMLVGLATLGICAAAVMVSPVVLPSIPLILIVSMGLSFTFITDDKSKRHMIQESQAAEKKLKEQAPKPPLEDLFSRCELVIRRVDQKAS